MNNNLSKIAEVIKQARSILITAHVFPDGDSIGSVLGLAWLWSLWKSFHGHAG